MSYLGDVGVGPSQFLNVLIGGDPDETVSSRLGKMQAAHGGAIPWRYPVRRVISSALDICFPGHCKGAIERDEGKDTVVKWEDGK